MLVEYLLQEIQTETSIKLRVPSFGNVGILHISCALQFVAKISSRLYHVKIGPNDMFDFRNSAQMKPGQKSSSTYLHKRATYSHATCVGSVNYYITRFQYENISSPIRFSKSARNAACTRLYYIIIVRSLEQHEYTTYKNVEVVARYDVPRTTRRHQMCSALVSIRYY